MNNIDFNKYLRNKVLLEMGVDPSKKDFDDEIKMEYNQFDKFLRFIKKKFSIEDTLDNPPLILKYATNLDNQKVIKGYMAKNSVLFKYNFDTKILYYNNSEISDGDVEYFVK